MFEHRAFLVFKVSIFTKNPEIYSFKVRIIKKNLQVIKENP